MKQKHSSKQFFLLIIAIAIGVLVGGFLPAVGAGLSIVGELFLRALLMLVVPLVMTSLITAVSNVGEARQLGKMGQITILYYLSTTAIAVLIGIIVVLVIQPGHADTEAQRIALRGGQILPNVQYQIQGQEITLQDGSLNKEYDNRFQLYLQDQPNISGKIEKIDDSRQAISLSEWVGAENAPTRPKAIGQGIRIDLSQAHTLQSKERSIASVLHDVVLSLVPKNLFHSMANNEILPLITVSIILGITLLSLGEATTPLIQLFENLNLAIMAIVHGIMKLAPYGIAALVAGRIAEAGGFSGFFPELLLLGKYTLTVILGLVIHGGIILPLAFKLLSPYALSQFIPNMTEALTTAFATSSSSATLPVTIDCITQKSHLQPTQDSCINGFIPKRVASFVLSLGATINMDGTALYEGVSAIFIAQVYGISLSFPQLLVIALTSTLAAIGAAGIPEAGLVTMVIVLKSADLPVEGISLILVIDWFLDRCRTTVNVWGDSVGTAIIAAKAK